MSLESDNRLRAALEGLGVEYEVLHCDPELADTAVFCAHYGYPLANSANTLIVAAKTKPRRYVACLLLATTRLDVNRAVRKRMGVRRLSFASAEETEALTGMRLGGVTPIGLGEELPLWVDGAVMRASYVILGGGSRNTKIKISPEVFNRTPNTSIIEDLAVGVAGESE